MSRRGMRQIVFVCIGLTDTGGLVSKIIPAASPDEASSSFLEENNFKAQEILGPFYKKRTRVLENTRSLKFTNEVKKATYNEWFVTAFLLKDPENHAYLLFNKRVDGKKHPSPKGVITVPLSDLRFI